MLFDLCVFWNEVIVEREFRRTASYLRVSFLQEEGALAAPAPGGSGATGGAGGTGGSGGAGRGSALLSGADPSPRKAPPVFGHGVRCSYSLHLLR